jgi:hypothetical protein
MKYHRFQHFQFNDFFKPQKIKSFNLQDIDPQEEEKQEERL